MLIRSVQMSNKSMVKPVAPVQVLTAGFVESLKMVLLGILAAAPKLSFHPQFVGFRPTVAANVTGSV